MNGTQENAGRQAVVRQPAAVEGRVADRANPTPLDRLSPGAVVTAQVLALGPALVAGVALAPHGVPVWVVPAIVGVVALVLSVRLRGTSIIERLPLPWRARREPAEPTPVSVELPDGTTMGIVRSDGLFVSVLAVREDTPVVTVDGSHPAATIPLGLLVDHLSRYDIDLHSIDVTVSAGRGRGNRAAWITLRFDPALDPDAVERRGGGDDGAVRTLVTVSRRLALRLGGEGLAVNPLDTTGIARDRARFAAAVGGPGADTDGGGGAVAVAGVLRRDALAGEHEGATWISLRGRDRAGRVHWCAALTFAPDADAPAGTALLDRFAGGDAAALGPAGPGIGTDSALRPQLDPASGLAALSPAPGGSGPLLGVDADGRAVRLGLHGRARHVQLIGSVHTARRIVLRALRGGAVVEVVTPDPEPWLRLRDPDHALLLRHPDDRGEPGRLPGLVVVVDSPTVHDRDATILTVTPHGTGAPRAAATLTENAGDAAGSLTVATGGHRLDVGLIELSDEAAVLGQPV